MTGLLGSADESQPKDLLGLVFSNNGSVVQPADFSGSVPGLTEELASTPRDIQGLSAPDWLRKTYDYAHNADARDAALGVAVGVIGFPAPEILPPATAILGVDYLGSKVGEKLISSYCQTQGYGPDCGSPSAWETGKLPRSP